MGTAEKPKPHSKLKQRQARKKQHAQAQPAGEAQRQADQMAAQVALRVAHREADQMAAQAAQDKQDKEQQIIDEYITYHKFILQTEDQGWSMWCEKCDRRTVGTPDSVYYTQYRVFGKELCMR